MKIHESHKIAIVTKYLGPTDRRDSRIVAKTGNGHRKTISYRDCAQAHAAAAVALCEEMGWTDGDLVQGGIKNGYVFVFAPKKGQ